jgi:hypothetical protein
VCLLGETSVDAKSSCQRRVDVLYSDPLDWALWRGRPAAEFASYPQLLIYLWMAARGTEVSFLGHDVKGPHRRVW